MDQVITKEQLLATRETLQARFYNELRAGAKQEVWMLPVTKKEGDDYVDVVKDGKVVKAATPIVYVSEGLADDVHELNAQSSEIKAGISIEADFADADSGEVIGFYCHAASDTQDGEPILMFRKKSVAPKLGVVIPEETLKDSDF